MEDDDSDDDAIMALVMGAAVFSNIVSYSRDNVPSQEIAEEIVKAVDASMVPPRKPRPKYRRSGGTLPKLEDSFWKGVDKGDDNLAFLHFTAFTREAFDELHSLVGAKIDDLPLRIGASKPKRWHLSRRFADSRTILAMTLRFLLSRAEYKDLCPQFGSIETVFSNCVLLGMRAIVTVLADETRSMVYWDRTEEGLQKCADRTNMFLDVPGVIAMIDGKRLTSMNPMDGKEQNRDYNGWTKMANRTQVFVWDPFGKIVDCACNFPGNFHDSYLRAHSGTSTWF